MVFGCWCHEIWVFRVVCVGLMWVWYFPGIDFESYGGIGVGAGSCIALFDSTFEHGIYFALSCYDDNGNVVCLFRCPFDIAMWGASPFAEGCAYEFRCDAVEEFFLIIS